MLSFGGMTASEALGGDAAASAPANGAMDDAVSALVNLGYRAVDAHGAVARAATDMGEGASVQALITAGLKELS